MNVLQPQAVSNNQIIVQGICLKTPANLLIDTGASISLVSTRLVNQIDRMHEIMPTSTLIAGLDNKIVPTKGEIQLPIELGNMIISHSFVVCNDIENEFLVGMDLINSFQIRLDIPNKKLCTPVGEEKFIAKPASLKNRLKIRCHKTRIIPANSVCYLMGRIPICNTKLNYEGIIDPRRKLAEDKGIVVTSTLSYSNKNMIPIHCVNVMPYDVTIYRNQLIAFMEPFEKFENIQGVHRIKSEKAFYSAKLEIPRLDTADPEEITRKMGKWENPHDLLAQLNIEDVNLTPEYKQQLKNLIVEYSHCFSKNKYDLGKASFYEAKIHLKRNFTPKWVPSRPISYKMQPQMDEEINNLIKSGQITKCNYSLWNSAVFLVRKPNGTLRYVQDCRALNKECLQDNYELPKINTILDGMANSTYFSSFDFTSSFTQLGLQESSQPLTAFTYKSNRFQWTRLVQGQTSSSSEFSRCMAQLFSKLPFRALVVYIDDILMGSQTAEEHLKRLRFILDRLSWGNLKLSPKKTYLFRREIKFLGHKLSSEGLRIDEDKIKAVQTLQPPTSVKQLQKFLGVLNYQRSFVRGFAEKAAPLYNLLKKEVTFIWSKECQDSFESLKTAMTTSPILALPDTSDPMESYEVTIDSSKRGQGATLSQIVNGKRRIISYWSRAVPKHMQKYGATKLEFLALHGAIKHWRLYLQGAKFTVLTDCRPLLNLDTIFSKENSYMQRRLSDLAGYKFTIRHISGKSESIQMADFLSRYPFEKSSKNAQTQTESYPESTLQKVLLLSETDRSKPITIEEIKAEYANDKILSEVIQWIKEKKKPNQISYTTKPAELCHYYKKYDLLKLKDDILYRKYIYPNDRTKDHEMIVVPCTLIERIVYTYHDTLASCHSGLDVSLEQCKKKFYFYKMANEFRLYIAACLTCNRNKQPSAYLKAPLKPIVYSQFGQGIAIDHLEPSKKATPRGTIALLTIVDMYSNYLVCVPVRSINTEESIKVVMHHWILKHGFPEAILHDLGKSFTSGLFQAAMKMFGIKDTKTTPYFSSCNGRAEAMNKRVNTSMRVSLHDNQWKDYDLWINYIVFTLNSLMSTRTGYSANFLVYGRELRMPRDLFLKQDDRLERIRSDITETDYKKLQAYNLYRQIADVTRKVRDNSEKRAMLMKKQYDKKVKGPFFKEGDLCFLLVNAPVHKYADRWRGPYLIVEKINDWNYILDINGVKKLVSISKMKSYKPNKYSQITAKSAHNRMSTNEKLPKNTQKSETKTKQKLRKPSDSSDDENWFITVERPRTRCEEKNTSVVPVADLGTNQNSDEETSHIDTSGISDSDALEALEDANKSWEQATSSNNPRSNTFDSIEQRRITLSDIERHEREKLKNFGTNSSVGDLKRSSTISDLPTRSDVPTPSSRYNLRPRTKKATKLKSPISAFKRLSKRKKK